MVFFFFFHPHERDKIVRGGDELHHPSRIILSIFIHWKHKIEKKKRKKEKKGKKERRTKKKKKKQDCRA